MQFNVLQALIEFMYYGETRITEENLTSLIEAAKLFEVRQLLLSITQSCYYSQFKIRNSPWQLSDSL